MVQKAMRSCGQNEVNCLGSKDISFALSIGVLPLAQTIEESSKMVWPVPDLWGMRWGVGKHAGIQNPTTKISKPPNFFQPAEPTCRSDVLASGRLQSPAGC